MQTKYTGRIWLAFLVGLAMIFSALLMSVLSTENSAPMPVQLVHRVHAAGLEEVPHRKVYAKIGGDCLADRYTGDIIKKLDWYCQPEDGEISVTPTLTEVVRNIVKRVRESFTPTPTAVPPTDSPTAIVTEVLPTATAQPSATAEPTEFVPTDSPTDVPTVVPSKTPKPEVTPKPTKVCHPNSGDGNDSEDCDGDGKDDDPGNSGGHNNGGD